jgi:hypothetical protein
MNKNNPSPDNFKQPSRINLSEIDPVKFKEAFIESSIFDSVMKQASLDRLVNLFFRLSILLSDSVVINNEERSDIIQILNGFHQLGKVIIDSGGTDKIEAKILLDEFLRSRIIDNILNWEELTRLAWDIFVVMQNIALDELAFEMRDRETIICRFQGLLSLVEKIIKVECHECESV